MAKSNRGGKRTVASSGSGGGILAQQLPNDTPPVQLDTNDVIQGNVQAGDVSFSDYMNMSDDDKADVILKAMTEDTPDFLEDSVLQRFVYSTGMNNKPILVSDDQLDSMGGTEIFRTVNNVYDKYNDVGYSAKEICDQLQMGDFTMYNANGGKAYGAGLYFANNYNHSVRNYGSFSDSRTQTMRAKISPNAKVITLSQANRNATKEMNSGSKFGKALEKVAWKDNDSVASLWALSRGYDVLDTQSYSGYYTVINRGALVMSSTTKSPQRSGQWK